MLLFLRLSCLLACVAWVDALADEYRLYVDDAPPSRRLLARLPELRADPANAGVTWTIVRLGAGAPAAEQTGNAVSALKDGVRYVPTIVMADKEGVAYARVIGAVSTREGRTFAERLSQARAMKQADRSGPTDRRKADGDYAKLYELVCRASHIDAAADAPTIRTLEKELRAALAVEGVPAAVRQHVALTTLYPLALRRYAQAYHGAHTPESEALFLRAVGILEEARDMNPASDAGRRAHQMREELRRARLQAARLD